jgi:hypothetical protein
VLRLAIRLAAIATVPVLAALPAGCSGHLGGIATWVTPDDYGERLCADVELEAYPSCLSNVLDYFEEPRADHVPGQSTSGPFSVIMEGGLYLGTYSSIPPFVASFRVSNGANACRGSYNAFTGSQDALFDVYCDDGRAGWAGIIRDQSGRNGIGQLTLNDGTQGEIVFGYVPLGQATPFPFTDVFTVPPGSRTNRERPPDAAP